MMDLATQPRFENMFQAQTYVVFSSHPTTTIFWFSTLYGPFHKQQQAKQVHSVLYPTQQVSCLFFFQFEAQNIDMPALETLLKVGEPSNSVK